jgi:hypothetical protein
LKERPEQAWDGQHDVAVRDGRQHLRAQPRGHRNFLVLPWHFKDGIMAREQAYLAAGGKMIFSLPEVEIVGG